MTTRVQKLIELLDADPLDARDDSDPEPEPGDTGDDEEEDEGEVPDP